MKYNSAIKLLLEKETDADKASVYFLSVYIPTEDYGQEEGRATIKSFILNALCNHKELKKNPWIHQRILDSVEAKINLLKGVGEGLAIFAKFNIRKEIKGENENFLGEIVIFLLHRRPIKEVTISKIFNLDQLIWIDTVAIQGVILNLSSRNCDIYKIDSEIWELIGQEKNKFVSDAKTNKYEENKKFFHYILRIIRKELGFQAQFDYFIIFYSVTFDEIVRETEKSICKYFPRANLVLIDKYFKDKTNLKKQAFATLKNKQKEISQELHKMIKTYPDKYVEGWEKVAAASRGRNVETLFVSPGARQKGFILQRNLVYVNALENAKPVANIVPWLVRSIFQLKGEVVFYRNAQTKNFPLIVARLRRRIPV
ncbi:MAG: hypothetical protein ABIF89_02435 [bacterium]